MGGGRNAKESVIMQFILEVCTWVVRLYEYDCEKVYGNGEKRLYILFLCRSMYIHMALGIRVSVGGK